MPYIKKRRRRELDVQPPRGPMTDGEMNYTLTCLITGWIGDDPTYGLYNRAIGILECVKLELYRRAVSEYEDDAIKRNGDLPEYADRPWDRD